MAPPPPPCPYRITGMGDHAAPTPTAASARPTMSPAEEKQIRGEVHEIVKKVSTKPLEGADFRTLAAATSTSAGARGLTDSLEWTFAQPGGNRHALRLLEHASATPESARMMTQAMAQMAAAEPVRTTGLLLLTTDQPGGAQHLNRMLEVATQTPQGSLGLCLLPREGHRPPGLGARRGRAPGHPHGIHHHRRPLGFPADGRAPARVHELGPVAHETSPRRSSTPLTLKEAAARWPDSSSACPAPTRGSRTPAGSSRTCPSTARVPRAWARSSPASPTPAMAVASCSRP